MNQSSRRLGILNNVDEYTLEKAGLRKPHEETDEFGFLKKDGSRPAGLGKVPEVWCANPATNKGVGSVESRGGSLY